jgi:NADH-quinone oxidoreductase subunit C
MTHEDIVARLRDKFGANAFTISLFRDNYRIHIAPQSLLGILGFLKNSCGFDMLFELTAADYLRYPGAKDRYGVVYGLLNIATGARIYVKTFVNDPNPTLPSVFALWRGADWLEREVYDMYGVVFDGHPDLRRILMPDDFAAFPLRKDYPLRGKGERHNLPVLTRAEG